MKSYVDNLECLSYPMSLGITVRLLLTSLSKKYDGFVQIYNMHGMGKTVNELHAMPKLHEKRIHKKDATSVVLTIKVGKIQKNNKKKKPQGASKGKNHSNGKDKLAYAPKAIILPPTKNENLAKDATCHHWKIQKNNKKKKPQGASKGKNHSNGKDKLAYAPKAIILPPTKNENLAKDATCHHCNEVGHWRRNYPAYLADLMQKKNKTSHASTSGVFVELEVIQEDTHPSENTSQLPNMVQQESVKPQSEFIPIRRSTRTHYATGRLCLYVESDEHALKDHKDSSVNSRGSLNLECVV
nr:hypothetical protein [Tanacetum cinerariifolium]